MMHDLHWKTGRQAARSIQHINWKDLKMFQRAMKWQKVKC